MRSVTRLWRVRDTQHLLSTPIGNFQINRLDQIKPLLMTQGSGLMERWKKLWQHPVYIV